MASETVSHQASAFTSGAPVRQASRRKECFVMAPDWQVVPRHASARDIHMHILHRAPVLLIATFFWVAILLAAGNARAADRLCDTAFENCRTQLLELIRAETVGIDVAFWFMEDT